MNLDSWTSIKYKYAKLGFHNSEPGPEISSLRGFGLLIFIGTFISTYHKEKTLWLHHQKCITWNCLHALKMKERHI